MMLVSEEIELDSTVVFEKNWNAINAIGVDGNRKYRYIINKGSSRSSKTISLIDVYDLYARENENKRLTVWRDTKIDCKKTVLNDALRHFKKTHRYKVEQDFNKTESIFTYDTGSTFEIHGTDDEETVHGLSQAAAWLNEPYKISRDTFDQIDQRTEDFVIIDLNPKKAHWYEDLEKDPRTIVINSTFKDNPFCPEEQRLKILSYQPVSRCEIVEKKFLKEQQARDYDLVENPLHFSPKQINELRRCRENEAKNSANDFNWSVYGLGEKGERPNRIFHWKEISVEVYKALNVPRYIGNDWGEVDPWGIVEVKYYDGGLYLHELNYASENILRGKLQTTELAQINSMDAAMQNESVGIVTWLYGKLGIDKTLPVICDTNRPLKIAALRRLGWPYAVPAGNKSIADGISILNNLKVYYTSSSTNLKYEQENYSRKVDRYGVVLEEPEDMDNHCFVADTLISTPQGCKRIMDLHEGDSVFTQTGVNKIAKIFSNGYKEVCRYDITFTSNIKESVTCTPTHKIYTKERGWLSIALLEPGMTVIIGKNSREKNITCTPAKDTFPKQIKDCMLLCMNSILEKLKKVITSIIKMKILTTITLLILNCLKVVSILANICWRETKMNLEQECIMQANLQKAGIHHRLARNGINNKVLQPLEIIPQEQSNVPVNNVANNIFLQSHYTKMQGFALQHADHLIEENQAWIMKSETVANAAQNLQSTDIQRQELVVSHVQIVNSAKQSVYDLMVENDHSYFANSILVHNCIDPVKYVALHLQKIGVIKII